MVLCVSDKQDVAITGNTLRGIEPSILQIAILETFLLPSYGGLKIQARTSELLAAAAAE